MNETPDDHQTAAAANEQEPAANSETSGSCASEASNLELNSVVVCRLKAEGASTLSKWRHDDLVRHFSDNPDAGVVDIKIHPDHEAGFVRFSSSSLAESYCSLSEDKYKGTDMQRTMFLHETALVSDARLVKFLRKPPYFPCTDLIREVAERKRRRQKEKGEEKEEKAGVQNREGAAMQAVPADSSSRHGPKHKKKKPRPLWEDY